MKYLNRITQIFLFPAVLFSIQSCTADFDKINRNKYQVDKEEQGRDNYNIGATLKGMQALVIPTEEHLYQFYDILAGGAFGGYFESTKPDWKTKFSTYNPQVEWQNAVFGDVIKDTYPLYRDMFNKTEDPVALALTKLLRVAIMHRSTDVYGPIPYSKIIAGNKGESLEVPYDSQEEVYTQMFKELDEVDKVLLENIHLSKEAFRKFDNVYSGDISKWVKYLHSLKLRMAIRIAYVKPDMARDIAQKAVSAGVITSNADNALLAVEENRAAMIFNDWSDHRVGADIICYMNGYKDPRREKMFTKVETGKGSETTDYYGMRIGIDPLEDKATMAATYSKPLITNLDKFLWMNAAEVTFLRAEGALRGWSMGGSAQDLYNQAIKLSFEERGAQGVDTYLIDNTNIPDAYADPLNHFSISTSASTITIKWDEKEDAATKELNLERIITQKWIAIFPLGIEAWSEYRRTGYPRLLPVAQNKSDVIDTKHMIRRLQFSPSEYSLNNANVMRAISLMGGPDNGATRVWWDVKPYN